MAFAATSRRSLASRGLSDLLARRLHPSLPQLLPSNSTGDPRKPSPLPPPPAPRLFNFALAHCGTSQTLKFPPFGPHLLPGPLCRSFSSSRDPDFTDVLTDAAHSAAPTASFPGEVAWAAEDSSTAVAAVQHLIDAVHSFTGLNWWISIALSTLLLRCVVSTLLIHANKRLYAKDDTSREKFMNAGLPFLKNLGLVVYLPPIVTPYICINLYIAISNMVEKVPSLKGGGAFWFTDLTTPDALCIFPMMTSLFIMLPRELNSSAVRKCERCSRKMDKIRQVWRGISLLPMLWTATLPQAISCSFVTWTSLGLAESIALKQPAVQKVLFGTPLNQRCSSCAGQKGPIAKDSPSPVKEQEQPVPPETRKSSDASVHKEESDENLTKGE
uniref:Uncharacterized protein n=1 Tax=Avena sativa TaxID=4498 RepID=A0ACD5TIV3_AVESA